MVVKDDESLKRTVEVALPKLRKEKVLNILILDRPSFMSQRK